jgi:hypothetical protein
LSAAILIVALVLATSVAAATASAGVTSRDVTEGRPGTALDSIGAATTAPAGAAVVIPNVGQAPREVLFEARQLSRIVRFTSDSVLFDNGAGLKLVGAHARAVRPFGRQVGVVNLLIGNDPADWHTDIPTFSGIVYEDVRPGIDAVVSQAGGRWTVAFSVAPGADFSDLRYEVVGADSEARSITETLSDTAMASDSLVVLDLDPIYASYLGGGRDDSAAGVALDAEGNAVVVGSTTSTNFPTENPLQPDLASGNLSDAFVTKLTADGSKLIWSTYLGGGQYDHASAVSVSSNGSVALAGYTASRDFPTQDPIQEKFAGGKTDAFVAVLAPDGSRLAYSSFLGGRDSDAAYALALGSQRGPSGTAIYVAGYTQSSDFPTENAFQRRFGGASDAFVTAIEPDGSSYVYSTYLGGTPSEIAFGIAVDNHGSVVVTGYGDGTGYPVENPFQRSFRGATDCFITRLQPDGSDLVFSTYLGGRQFDRGRAVALKGNGNVVVVGWTSSSDFPTEKPLQANNRGSEDAFVSEFLADGSALVFSTFLGGSRSDWGYGVVADSRGDLQLVGTTSSGNFPTEDAVQARLRGGNDAFVTVLAADGQSLRRSTYYGGAGDDSGYGVAAADDGQSVVVGYTESADFPTHAGFQTRYGGQGDAFVLRVGGSGPPPTEPPATIPPSQTPRPSVTPTATPEGPQPSDTPVPPSATPSPTELAETPSPSPETPEATDTPDQTATPGAETLLYIPIAMK